MPESNELHGVSPPNQPHDSSLVDAVVTSAPIVLFATDAAGVITMSRGKALEALGLREGELVGRSLFVILTAGYLQSQVDAGAITWDAITWDAITWDAITWDAITWDAITWDAITWDAITWDAITWDAITWDAVLED